MTPDTEPTQILLFDTIGHTPAPEPLAPLPDSPAAMPRNGYLVYLALRAYGAMPLSVGDEKATPWGVLSLERVMKREHGYEPPSVARAVAVAIEAGYVVIDNGVYTTRTHKEP